MPQVSVIVPVYRTEGYLAECLDSILSQDCADIEIIAINDASPDGSLALLRDYSARDRRLRIIDFTKHRGLGAARNAGIKAARGKWLWFVDSDDAIAQGAIRRAVGRGESTGAEVVVFHWTRHYEDGPVLPGTWRRFLVEAPDCFSVAEYPAILRLLQIVCNKLIRRDLLSRLDLTFVDGWYEDTPFNYPLLLGADAITTLPEALLEYRQRDDAITRTHSARHLEVLDQWAVTMERVRHLPKASPEVRANIFHMMARHCADVLLRHDRVPAGLNKVFLTKLSSLLRTNRPSPLYPAAGRLDRLQQLLLMHAPLPRLVRYQYWLTQMIRPIIHGPRPNSSHPRAANQPEGQS